MKSINKIVLIVIFSIALLIIIFLGVKLNNEIKFNKFLSLIGFTQEEVHNKVGKPTTTSNDGSEFYKLKDKEISIYYDENGIVNHINFNGEYIMNAITNTSISSEKQFQFKATVIEVYPDGNLVVEPYYELSTDNISVKANPNEIWEVGMEVIVTYTGEIIETYPAQINAIDVQIYYDELMQSFNESVNTLDRTIFETDFVQYEDLSINTEIKISESEAKQIAEKGFKEGERIWGECNIFDSITISEVACNDRFTIKYNRKTNEYAKRKAYVIRKYQDEYKLCGADIYVDVTTGKIIGGKAFGD